MEWYCAVDSQGLGTVVTMQAMVEEVEDLDIPRKYDDLLAWVFLEHIVL